MVTAEEQKSISLTGAIVGQGAGLVIAAGIGAGGVTSNGSDEDEGVGALVKSTNGSAETAVTSRMRTVTMGKDELEPLVRFAVPSTLKATMPRLLPERLPSRGE